MSHSRKNNEINQYTDIGSHRLRNNQVTKKRNKLTGWECLDSITTLNKKPTRCHENYEDQIERSNQYSEPDLTTKKRNQLTG